MRPLLLDARALAETRAAVEAGRDVPGLAELRIEADAAAAAEAVAVTSKTVPAPSGDPHDYVSLSIYWWPDPSTPDGLPYVQADGRVNPDASDPARYDAPKLNRLVSSAESLALAFALTGERRYADATARWLRAWAIDPATRMNPSMRYAQVIPGRPAARGTGVIDSRQLLRAIDAALLIEGSAAWGRADDRALRAWIWDLVDWMTTSENGRLERAARNNHRTWFDAQLAGFAVYARRDADAAEAIERVSAERIPAQIEPDGTQPLELARTRSYHYSGFNLLAVAVAADLAPAAGAEVWQRSAARIRPAIDLLVRHAEAPGSWPYPDIDRIEPFGELAPFLARAARAYPDAGYDRVLARLALTASAGQRLRLRLGAFGALGGTAAAPAPLTAAV